MRIGIAGAGGVGGLLGGLLARHGAKVALLARGAHLAAIRERGLHIEGTLGDFTAAGLAISDRGADLGRCDAVIVAVKTWQLERTLAELRPMIGDGTVIVPLQNGIGAWDLLARELGETAVAGGITYVNSWVEAPGVIRQLGPTIRVAMGERGGGTSSRLAALADVLAKAGITALLEPDITKRNWEKFLGFEPMAIVGALSRSTIGTFRADAGARGVLAALMHEVAAIGRARGVALSADAVERRLATIDGLAPAATISMQRDLMSGRPSEFMEQSVGLVALARELGVATPAHDLCVPLLLLQERAARANLDDAATPAPAPAPAPAGTSAGEGPRS
jgi:2-dehydropantoate 2-reductase